GARRAERLSALMESMEASRTLAHPYEARDPQAPGDWVRPPWERFGRIDCLVNNAGVLYRFSVEDDNEALLDEMWEVNTKGPLRLIRAAFPHLKASGAGRVV